MINKGKEIICVNAVRTAPEHLIPNWIEKDKIYSIRAIQASLGGNGFGFLLEEVKNDHVPAKMNGNVIGSFEPGFNSERFRELDGTELVMSMEKEETIKQN